MKSRTWFPGWSWLWHPSGAAVAPADVTWWTRPCSRTRSAPGDLGGGDPARLGVAVNAIRWNGWGKLLLVVVPLAVVAAVALVRTSQKVETLGAEVDKRALRETVYQQYQALIREIGALRDDVRALRRELSPR